MRSLAAPALSVLYQQSIISSACSRRRWDEQRDMFGLYGDLPQAKTPSSKDASDGPASTWFPSKLKPAIKKSTIADLSQNDAKTSSRHHAIFPPLQQGDGSQGALSSSIISVRENAQEYDPGHPNDYEEVRKAREHHRKEAELEVERQERIMLEARRQEHEQDQTKALSSKSTGHHGGQPNLDISGEEAFQQRARLSKAGSSGSTASDPRGMNLAARMMEKMGWKEGQGLGKSKQGIVTPLIAQKTDARSGVIINAQDGSSFNGTGHQDKRPRLHGRIQGEPTRVVLLRNMVGPGEVDDDLEDEVGMECSKYGSVQSVVIFEVTEPGFPTHQAVRIFVEFDREEAATKALVDLGGRFFGGQTVQATFFDMGRYERRELAPTAEELL